MSDFILDGYWDFNTALNAVGKHLFGDAWDWQEPAIPSVEDFISEQVSLADGVRLMKETAGPLDPWQLDSALDWLRQRLHAKRLPSHVLAQTGEIEPIPFSEWGRTDFWDNADSSGRIEFMENWGRRGGRSQEPFQAVFCFGSRMLRKNFLHPRPLNEAAPQNPAPMRKAIYRGSKKCVA